MRDAQRQQDFHAGGEEALDAMLAQDRQRRGRPAVLAVRIRRRFAAWWQTLARCAGRRPF